MDDDLEKALATAIEERTFSLDAVEAIKALRTEVKAVKAELAVKANTLKEKSSYITQLQAKEKQLAEYEARTSILKSREKDCIVTEVRNEFEKKRGDEMKEVLMALTRNLNYRKSVYTSGMVPNGDSYGGTVNVSDSTDETNTVD